jgi:hypothetical protein
LVEGDGIVRLGEARVKPWTLMRGWGNEVGENAHGISRSGRRSSRVEVKVLGGIHHVNYAQRKE